MQKPNKEQTIKQSFQQWKTQILNQWLQRLQMSHPKRNQTKEEEPTLPLDQPVQENMRQHETTG